MGKKLLPQTSGSESEILEAVVENSEGNSGAGESAQTIPNSANDIEEQMQEPQGEEPQQTEETYHAQKSQYKQCACRLRERDVKAQEFDIGIKERRE